MLITTTVANYDIGGTPGNFINPQVVTLQAETLTVSLSAKLVNGAGQYATQQSGKLRVWYGTSAHLLSAAAGAVAIREARYLDIVPSSMTSGTVLVSSLIESARGGYLYFWFETPAFSPVAVVSVSVSEFGSGAGAGYTSSVSVIRPDNTTAYTAGDVLGVKDATTAANAGSAIWTFTNIGPAAGGWVWIDMASLRVDVAAIPAGMSSFKLHFYSSSPTAILDNAVFNLVAADRSKYQGFIPLPTALDFGDTLWSETEGQNYQIRKLIYVPSGGSLFGELQTDGGFTPAALTVKTVTLHSVLA